ncbi:MAG: molecular chaperone DnaK [Bacteroidales bacterium]|nr:molecular chaperone DnaK [Bacteroidales bacterium]
MSKVIGIDLGSTLSEVAVMEGGKPTIIVNEEGGRTTPSVVSLKGGERKVGAAAKRQAITSPKDTIVLIKRFMGGTYDEVKDNISHVQYDVKNVNGYPKVSIDGKEYSPEEISAMILSKLKANAEAYLGESVKDAVITVPAFFGNEAREATKKAGEIAGLKVLRIIAEPTAAILASGIDLNKSGKYMVVDYGGSTLDFSVADISDKVVEILSSFGDVYCGGSDLDKLVTDWIVSEFKKDTGVDISKDPMAMSRVIEAAEKAKVELSNGTTTEINLPYITAVDSQPLHLAKTLTKAKFEQLIDGEIKKVMNCGKEALEKAKINAKELDGILLVGGSTRIPYVQEQLEKTFGVQLIKTANPDECVACGAAVQGGILGGEKSDIVLLDVTPLNLGIETMGGVMTNLIEANTSIPAKKSQIFSTAVDNQPGVEINVLQGNRPMAKDNKQIGIFHLDGIAPAPAHVPQIEVTFDIDSNGILTVTAVDKATGKEQHVTIESKGGLTSEEIERMKREAEEYADADKKAKENADKVNNADAFAYQVSKSIDEFKDKVTDDEKKELSELTDALKKAADEKNIEEIDSKMKELQEKWYPIAQRVYQESVPKQEEEQKS